jgi:hypothetical protein
MESPPGEELAMSSMDVGGGPGPSDTAAGHPTEPSPQELELEVAALRRQLAEQEQRPPSRHRLRWTFTAILAVLTVLAIIATTVAVWTNRTAFDTDRFMALTEPVLESPEVTDAISVRVTDEVLSALTLEERLEARLSEFGAALSVELAGALDLTPAQQARIESLPLPQLTDLAAPIASGLEARIATRIDQFVSSERFQQLLVDSTELAHTKAVALLRGDFEQLPNVEVEAGEVRLNLISAVATVLEDLVDQGLAAIGIEEIPFIDPFEDPEASIERLSAALGTELPPDFGQLTVMSEAELTELQDAASAADQLTWGLVVLSLVLLALTIAVAPKRRRALVQVGLGTAAATVVTMALVRSTQDEIAGVAVTPQGREALDLLADATFDSLRTTMIVVLVVSLSIAAVAYLAGRPRWVVRTATAVREATAAKPGGSDLQRYVVAHHDALRIGVIAVAVALLFLIGIDLWSVLVLTALVLLTLWGLATVRDQAPAAVVVEVEEASPSEPASPEPPVIHLDEEGAEGPAARPEGTGTPR